jgi:hypothetical protein
MTGQIEDLNTGVLDWSIRSGAMPSLPGSNTEWVNQLASLLELVKDDEFNDPQQTVTAPNGKTVQLQWYCNQLSPAGLLTKTPGQGIQLTPYASVWLEGRSEDFLARTFHRHLRYVGELLGHLSDSPQSTRELFDLANEEYRLGWKTHDPVHRRVKWLTGLGFIGQSDDLKHALTEPGRQLLESLSIEDPKRLWPNLHDPVQVELPPAGPEVGKLLEHLATAESAHDSRRHVVSYIPSNATGSPIDTLRLLCSVASPEVSLERLEEICLNQFGLKASSARSALTTMRTLGLYEPAGRSNFRATPPALEWINGDDDVALVRIIHCHVRFVGELLQHVDDLKRAPKLHELGISEYGVEAASYKSTGKLMAVLKDAGVLHEVGYAQYEATTLGTQLAQELPLAQSKTERNRTAILSDLESSSPTEMDELDALAADLRQASIDSSNPTRFEKLIQKAFERLGASSAHLGGAGNTDVLVELGHGVITYGRAIIDGKTSASGVVGENLISFPALREHRAKHEAQFAAIVGPSFHPGRLQQWAIDENVALISVDDLVIVLQRQMVTPLSPPELTAIFTTPGGCEELQDRWAAYDRHNELTRLIVRSLEREAEEEDPLLGAALDVRSIYRDLRDRIHPRPSEEELKEILSFLSSPLVRLVKLDKNGYSLLEAPATAALRLRSIASMLTPPIAEDG